MTFVKEDIPIQFADLKSVLSQSRAIDPALYQTIQILIERLDKFKTGHDSTVTNINNSVNTILSNTIITPNITATYITSIDEKGQLPQSVQLLAGPGIAFDDSVANKRTISTAAGGGMNLDYFGNYAPGTYNDGDIVVGTDGVTYMCVKDGTTTPPESWPGGGSTGPVGPAGPPGPSSSVIAYKADTISVVAGDPGAGKVRWNNTTQNLATTLYINKTTDAGFDASALLQSIGIQDELIIQDRTSSTTNQVWKLIGATISGGSYFSVPVVFVSGTAVFTNNQNLSIVIKYGAAGANLDYFGDYTSGTYYDGDIVVGTDGIAYMCVKDGTTTPPESWPGGGNTGPHAPTHITSGNDIIDVKLLGGFPGGTSLYLRADGTFATPTTGVPGAHAITHKVGGIDPVDVKTLAGYPGDGSLFLNGMGSFVAPSGGSGGTPSAHHTTHETGGSDAITSLSGVVITSGIIPDARLSANVALKNIDNNFVDQTMSHLKLTGVYPQLKLESQYALIMLTGTTAPTDSKKWRIWTTSGDLNIDILNDAESALVSQPVAITRAGHVEVTGRLQIGSIAGMSPSYPAWRNTSAGMECVLGDNSNWATLKAMNFTSVGGGNVLADITVTGGTNFAGGLVGAGNLGWSGNIINTGFLYPGRQDSPGKIRLVCILHLILVMEYGLIQVFIYHLILDALEITMKRVGVLQWDIWWMFHLVKEIILLIQQVVLELGLHHMLPMFIVIL
jgi:hypothetical protein